MPVVEDEVSVQLPYGPPPVLPDIEKQLKEYLLCPERLPIHSYEQAQQFWPRVPNPDNLYFCELSPLGTTLKVDRDPTTGKLLQFKEVAVDDIGCTSKNSLSLRRAPQPFGESVRGSDSNFPFWPGGFPELNNEDTSDVQDTDIDFENDLLHIAPGFSCGIEFKADGHTPLTDEDQPVEMQPELANIEEDKEEPSSAFNLMDVMKQEEDLLGLWKESSVHNENEDKRDAEKMFIESMNVGEEELKVIPEKDTIPVLKISKASPPPAAERIAEWAEKIDGTQCVPDFHQRIPNPAHIFHFDLDPFQQQAILKLEEHSNVFVAAHTSAGKTVVAEYAIHLSIKHKTKAVYTSPIKALSNQKFREFKKSFDVGLITGDIQINKEANCLIMTTEILRSMLYQGSEVMRDLEFVIFDEVHYINNVERGHVWEEALILLPKDVTIIMLSATVHNTLEFANWVGMTKQKKMYVISTLKRPVPLEHFLYTGTGGKQKNDRFLILNANGKFKEEGYNEAKQAKERKKPGKDGSKGPRPVFSQKQEKTMWEALISHLKEKKLLPVIAFTLSRNRCDENARNLNVDLTTQREKAYIRIFFKKCLDKLKDCDKKLPQVLSMQRMLERGIGVHHSGILPLLKEIVEMLFQKEKVKLLFATETFAMGVNMPAHTVIFDSIRKFNGLFTQNLLPAEYIQMAGRAGRRGLDDSGTVIILCKVDVPKMEDLKSMMLGQPEKLTSQFRLTYSMILRLLRFEHVTVEYMMSSSFMEFKKQTRQRDYKQELLLIQAEIDKFQQSVSSAKNGNDSELSELYHSASEYLYHFSDIRLRLFSLPRAVKDLQPGRVLLITHEEHYNKLALLLKVETLKRESKYHVLVLCNNEHDYDASGEEEIRLSVKNEPKKEVKKKSPNWYKMLGLVNYGKTFVPDGICEHTVLIIGIQSILDITTKSIKVNTELILNDWSQRQMPRFRDKEPGPSCLQAVQELTQMSLNYSEVSFVNICKDKMNDIEFMSKLKRMEVLLERIKSVNVAGYPHFMEEFESIFHQRQLEKQRDDLKHLQSHQSMTLYPDYQSRVQVLKNMNYVNQDNTVPLKGIVAIKMRNHEILITEMVLGNILTELPPAEIAALLSCLVFQQRSKFKDDKDEEEELGESLKEGIKKIKEIECKIKKEERKCGCGEEQQPSVNQDLNFDLVRVVYEWAKGKPFSDIMNYTVDVQEGIIVRCIQQLSETINDVKDAATTVGNSVLKLKMEDAQKAIKRDIVFLSSLYTTDTTLPKPEELDYENKDE